MDDYIQRQQRDQGSNRAINQDGVESELAAIRAGSALIENDGQVNDVQSENRSLLQQLDGGLGGQAQQQRQGGSRPPRPPNS